MAFSPLNYVRYISPCGFPVKVESSVDAEEIPEIWESPLTFGVWMSIIGKVNFFT
jgi:hypothetical protein